MSGYVSFEKNATGFALVNDGKAAPIYYSEKEFPGAVRAIKNLQTDIQNVSGVLPGLATAVPAKNQEIIIVGTIGKHPLIDKLIKSKKIDVGGVAGKWETFVTQVVEKPLPGVEKALVIAGSDKRGTIFGVYDLAEQIGVSPWYWWADVPVAKHPHIFILPGRYTLGEPKVKYRGIFINDEAPALSGWTHEKNGGFNHKLYEKVFELILRMKGNYLWPAMWGNAFNTDDTLNPVLADEYGIVMGTSHHEPMLRAQAEWKKFGKGPWNYNTNETVLKDFWKQGIVNMKNHESIVTIGMRGDGDEPMTEGTHIALLEKIVKDQREIIQQVTNKPVAQTPQLWALYKEVQDYYDKGMRVPDDVTLLLCDDNWGNIRKLPAVGEKQHAGGYGIYYHFDYVGGPRNYKWLNTNPIQKVWEQMHLAYQMKADRIWLVNVGDIKPMEFPISFFLDYAWNPEAWPQDSLQAYTRRWCSQQFGSQFVGPIANIIDQYTKFNGRRKPELLSPSTYSLTDYQEAENIVSAYNKLAEDAEKIYNDLPAAAKDAYYQLVLYPVKACANLNELYVTVGKNRLYARQGRVAANDLAAQARQLFDNDALLSAYYNTTLSGGKWNHFMDQTHIGYTYWQQPDKNSMPEVNILTVSAIGNMGLAVEGSGLAWPSTASGEAFLPAFNPYQPSAAHYFEVFNKGLSAFNYQISSSAPWVLTEPARGTVEKERRIWVAIDWPKAPTGFTSAWLTVTGANNLKVRVRVDCDNPVSPKPGEVNGFVATNGYVSMEAEHFSRSVNAANLQWAKIPGYGRTLSAMTAFPLTVPAFNPAGDSPRLEYDFVAFSDGTANVQLYFGPTLNFHGGEGLRYAVSFDNEPPQTVFVNLNKSNKEWEVAVSNNTVLSVSTQQLKAGKHTLKFWLVDPGLVLQKIVVDLGGLKPSYLGPPESFFRLNK